MSVVINFVLMCEGPSDRSLAPHLETLLVEAGASEAIGTTDITKGVLAERMHRLLSEQSGIDLLFIHRDADAPTPDRRADEIRKAVENVALQIPHVPVIPVQETEAWLLVDEDAIRAVAGRPRGRAELGLPRLQSIERTSNPKEILQQVLVAACEQSGRRLAQERRRFSGKREVLLQRLDTRGPVRGLRSWQRLEEDVESALKQLSDRRTSLSDHP